ncbi:MAG: branched-chain amino acid ABC transporter permease, partial [Chloroflexi bacterium]|nr:branched-chain amino acid ABC transporter permease [Chloroflexota bacterium]
FGVMRILNFAHGTLMMVGMYVTYWAFALLGLDPYLSLVICMPALFFLGYALQKVLINRVLDAPEDSQILLTLGVSLFIQNAALELFSPDYRTVKLSYQSTTFDVMGSVVTMPRLLAFVFSLAMAAALYVVLQRTDLGRAIRAAAQDREGAQLVGVNVRNIYGIAFGIGAACVGAAGTLVVPFLYVAPDVGNIFVLNAFVVVVLGGMGSLPGAVAGGLIVGLTESLSAAFIDSSLRQGVIFVLFVLVLLFRPSGLFGVRNV